MANILKAKHVRTGLRGEAFIKDMLEAQGYDVSYPNGNCQGDLLVFCPLEGTSYRLEVKTANQGIDGKFNFCMYRQGHTDCSFSDVIALVFQHKRKKTVRFIAASTVSHLYGLKIASLPETYSGKWADLWRNTLVEIVI